MFESYIYLILQFISIFISSPCLKSIYLIFMYKWWTFPLGQSTGNDGSHVGKSARKKERCRCSSNSTDVLFASNANSIIFSVLVETSFFWDLPLLNFCLLSKQLYVGFYRQCCPQTILGRLFFMFYFSGLCEVTIFFFHRAAPPILHSEWTCLRECFKQDILLCSADYKIIFCLLRLARVPLTWDSNCHGVFEVLTWRTMLYFYLF